MRVKNKKIKFYFSKSYYRAAVGAFIMFDVTNYKSFDSVQKWKDGIDDKGKTNPEIKHQKKFFLKSFTS